MVKPLVPWILAISATTLAGLAVVAGAVPVVQPFGHERDLLLRAHSMPQFGVTQPLGESSSIQVSAAQALADPRSLVSLARAWAPRSSRRPSEPTPT